MKEKFIQWLRRSRIKMSVLSRRDLTNLLLFLFGLVCLALVFWSVFLDHFNWVISHSQLGLYLTTLVISVGPEFGGMGISIIILDWLIELRQNRQLKDQLIRQMGSRHNEVADTAVQELRARRWLINGSIKSPIILFEANLAGVDLHNAKLINAGLYKANLEGAKMGGIDLSGGSSLLQANLRKAELYSANLQDAALSQADLSGANLYRAKLQKANLHSATFDDANLTEANLSEANLQTASFVNANLNRAILEGALLHGTLLIGADLEGAMLRNALLESAWVTPTQLAQASNLDGAIMFDKVKLKSDDHPDGPTYDEWLMTTGMLDVLNYLVTVGDREVHLRALAIRDSLLAERAVRINQPQ